MRWSLRAICVLGFAGLSPGLVAAQAPPAAGTTVGPRFCIECHDHQDERDWWERRDGPPPHGHVQALGQLEGPAARRMAAAVGLADPRDARGGCVPCHATVVRGQALAGVSCESCHGPGRGYLVVHQEKDAYRAATAAGLLDTIDKPEAWAAICLGCHVIDDRRLAAAGHPTGADFVLARKVPPVVHWREGKRYDAARLASAEAAARAAMAAGTAVGLPALNRLAAAPPPAPPVFPADRTVPADPATDLDRALAALLRGERAPAAAAVAAPAQATADPFLELQRAVLRLGLQSATLPEAR